jgi:hypothetical protein
MIPSVRFLVALLMLASVGLHPEFGSGQERGPDAAAAIKRIMSSAFARCFIETNGIRTITFVPPTNEEVAEVNALGDDAIDPLTAYLEKQPKDGFTQLFAVRFLMAIHNPRTFDPLAKAFGHDQWEGTRAAALNGMYAISKEKAKPYVKAALTDESDVVKQSATHLWALYDEDAK